MGEVVEFMVIILLILLDIKTIDHYQINSWFLIILLIVFFTIIGIVSIYLIDKLYSKN